MSCRKIMMRAMGGIAILGLLLSWIPAELRAGTSGKLSGRVLDQNQKPVVAATIALVGQPLGAISDADGYYSVINVPPGSYEVNCSRIGYQTRVVKEVLVSADETTKLDFPVQEAALQMEEVVVTSDRSVVDVNLTSTRVSMSSKQIETLPVQELQDVVNLQAGVVNGHFRGGRIGEVQYQVDGVSVNNPYNNETSLRLDRSLLQEVQVISGTFDAEYGQAMSGVVNACLKEGTKEFHWNAESYSGGFVFPGNDGRLADDTIRPSSLQNYQLSLSGPLAGRTVYLLNGRRYLSDDYIQAERRFLPSDSSDFARKIFRPTGDRRELALGYTHEWSGIAKLTNTSIPGVSLNYQAIVNKIEGRRTNFSFRYNPDGLTTQTTWAITHGVDWTHTLSPTTFYTVALRQNYFDYKDLKYESVWDPRYDEAGPTRSDDLYATNAVLQGVEFTRFKQRTSTLLWKASLVSQVRRDHQLKAGMEMQFPKVEFGVPGYLVYSTVDGREQLVRHVNEPPDYPGVRRYEPVIASTFLQDQLEWNDFTVRAGWRLDWFDARAKLPSDLANPANAIAGAPQSNLEPASDKYALSPRLGVAYPITERAGIHFAYGHFYQFPGLGQIFDNADYRVLRSLQAGGISYGVLGNPDVKPEKTVQYEFGYKQAVTDELGVDVSVFYKDIRDLLGVEFVSTYNGAEYARLTNVDFGNVVGYTVAVDHRRIGPLSAQLDYTWQLAQGNASDPRETSTRAAAGEDPRPRQVPFNWDQRHTFNLTTEVRREGVFAATGVLRVASGQPFTPILEAGFGNGLDANSGRKPSGVVLDLRAERYIRLLGRNTSAFGRVFNALDTRFFNGDVFNSTGSPFYSRFPAADRGALLDPTRFYAPRRIEVGITVNSGM